MRTAGELFKVLSAEEMEYLSQLLQKLNQNAVELRKREK
jgi:hypothetical protein